MFNEIRLKEVLIQYTEEYDSHWKNEKYKWEAVKWFQDNWNINAENFAEMLERSLDKTFNLLASVNNFPRAMIIEFANSAPEEVRSMFIALFDESRDVYDRIKDFKYQASIILEKYGNGAAQHYQYENAISIYLWLRYPDKYYIYKFSEVRTVANELEADYNFKKGAYADNIRSFLRLYDEIDEYMKKDTELIDLFKSRLTDSCYPDPELRTLTTDLGFYISRYYKSDESDNDSWIGEDYDPGLSVDDWIKLLNNPEVFTTGSLEIMKRMIDYGGMASCTQLAVKYGETKNFYNSGSVALARRVCEETGVEPKLRADGSAEWWSVLYVGRHAGKDEEGSFIWKLRDELAKALEKVDLSGINLTVTYDINTPNIWKSRHGTHRTGVSDENKKRFESRKVDVVHGTTASKGKSKTSQGDDFVKSIKKGDLFYLCYGNNIQLLGRFTTDEATENQELKNGWYERPYEIIKESVNSKHYSGPRKWWAPNNFSTCIKVKDSDLDVFENLILGPYFDMSLSELSETAPEMSGYWWLNANPKIWSFSDIAIGEVQDYTLYNEAGNKRRIFQNFLDAKAGDLIIGYESTPIKQVVAIGRIVAEQDGEKIYFEKIEGLSSPIDYAALKECPELEKMEYFQNAQGSLFKLTKGEFDFIIDLIREENPISSDEDTDSYSKEEFLDEVFMTEGKYNNLVAVLKNKKNIILQGAPGVGKTFAARRLSWSIMGEKDDSRIEFVQFHQNYSYEDFMMGYKPVEDGFELKYGIFYRFCKKAENQPDKEFFFIIDEINRGNMSKIFGELLMLIERDYRGTKATLAYNGIPFSVPKNLYIIGMMNTADRSLAMIDYALRRRFSFFEMEPGFDSEGFIKYQNEMDNEILNELIYKVKDLNREISLDKSLGKGFCIGHSYFCGRDVCTEEWLHNIVDYDILPMLSEYWFDEPNQLKKWENILQGVFQ